MAKVARAGQEKRDSRIMGEFSNYYKDDIDDKQVTSKYNCSQLKRFSWLPYSTLSMPRAGKFW